MAQRGWAKGLGGTPVEGDGWLGKLGGQTRGKCEMGKLTWGGGKNAGSEKVESRKEKNTTTWGEEVLKKQGTGRLGLAGLRRAKRGFQEEMP